MEKLPMTRARLLKQAGAAEWAAAWQENETIAITQGEVIDELQAVPND